MFFITHKFFHNNCPGKPLPGHSSFYRRFTGKTAAKGSLDPANKEDTSPLFFFIDKNIWKSDKV